MAALKRTTAPTSSGGKQVWKRGARKRDANQMGATIGRLAGKAPSDRPALKPYWGKPAVRNFRGGDGNVGIIRSPVRAIALPDKFFRIHPMPLSHTPTKSTSFLRAASRSDATFDPA